ncbi:oxygenase MpaB family protein [Spirillospora sp. NPDC047279]|uniref:oxygenase MpaB family protein n=1 Tax=Spirillospora sp. NPDC047279 TaxID=3155478 RepID=UPI003410EDC1
MDHTCHESEAPMVATAPDPATRSAPVPEIARKSISVFALAAASANVIMQLSRLPVGRGVAESRVQGGRVDKHPIKRARTTLSYIMVAMHGTDAEREAMRLEVDKQHRQVVSRPGDDVKYNAFSRDLQLWVAACLYWGTEDIYIKLYGQPSEELRDDFYHYGAKFGTTLQVTDDMWPADRAAFEKYWQDGLDQIQMDDVTRGYLLDLIDMAFLSAPVRRTFGPLNRFLTLGYLPQEFRDELGVSWTARHQARFDRYVRTTAAVNKVLPRPIRELPWNVYGWDVSRRIRKGRAIV